jgi:hypothetical protein
MVCTAHQLAVGRQGLAAYVDQRIHQNHVPVLEIAQIPIVLRRIGFRVAIPLREYTSSYQLVSLVHHHFLADLTKALSLGDKKRDRLSFIGTPQ